MNQPEFSSRASASIPKGEKFLFLSRGHREYAHLSRFDGGMKILVTGLERTTIDTDVQLSGYINGSARFVAPPSWFSEEELTIIATAAKI